MKVQFATLAVLLLGSSHALAHAGDHNEGLLHTLFHMLTQPDHLATLAIAAVAAFALWRYVSKRST